MHKLFTETYVSYLHDSYLFVFRIRMARSNGVLQKAFGTGLLQLVLD